MRKSDGFTLIELMVTIALMGIIASFAVPSLSHIVRNNQLMSDTRGFVDLLAETRSEAIFKQKTLILAVNGNISGGYKNWVPIHVTKVSGDNSVTFGRLGQTGVSDSGQCFIFKHEKDAALKSYVYVQKSGIVVFGKTATICPT